jgi:hypothetical protein
MLDRLLKEHRAHHLPLPPNDARLVRYRSGGGGMVNNKVMPDVYSLAFQMRGKDGKQELLTARVLWPGRYSGFIRRYPGAEGRAVVPVKPVPAAARRLAGGEHETMFFALQCHSLGWTELAIEVLGRARVSEGAPSLLRLRKGAWDYWVWQVPNEGSDWRAITARLKALMAEEETLRQTYHRSTVSSLEAALIPRKTKPGSIEALIDVVARQPARTGTIGLPERAGAADRLSSLGFTAVPVLIDHLGDQRMTRHVMQGFNNFHSWPMRVEDVVSDLLEEIAGRHLGRDWLRRQQGYPVKKADALAWWDEARKVGEEGYALRHVLPDQAKDPHPHQLRIIREKYPKHLPRLYRKVLAEQPTTQSWALAEAVAQSSLPRHEKLRLLHAGAMGRNLMHRREALYQLLELDRTFFLRIVRQTLLSLPRDVPGAYWRCEEAHYARFVTLADDPVLWKQLEQTARCSTVGLRMELLNHTGEVVGDKVTPTQRRRHLALFAAFLDDKASRDQEADQDHYSGPCAGFHYNRLSVRDFAAMQMAWYLRVGVPLKPDRSAKEWEQFRQRVRAAWQREQDKDRAAPPQK